ncbi:MAG TPA: methylenetetrahydrofolate--tRNA-(uracil(54)-C(5))-methyltransferase (FADH(2)-oxidizing) TrmFO [Candidatus Limnocylindria bacterium]|nr:methylenetetrahydrofolate--tRNA-(uracil(54)-C(5))-methyltransferase (FADH(2)-oxidizing) TrmFO [Candidatus Limnocylindria bacterium]
MSESGSILVVGAGLAGSEAAWQLARRGLAVELLEMRPSTMTPAHKTGRPAELVCTNSFKSDIPEVAAGLLKEELRQLGSLVLRAADAARVPSGQDLSVDRDAFARGVEAGLTEAHVRVTAGELTAIDPGRTTIVATGPLTSPALASRLEQLTGQEHLHFFDAAAPIVVGESLERETLFQASRYGKGGGAYLNVPLQRPQYEAFVAALVAAEQVELHAFEKTMWFEACLPIEEICRRGPETLRFGPLKPLGLTDPRTGQRPYAVVQLRPDDAASDLYNLVGFQTNLRWPEQRRIFRTLPGFAKAEFARLGVMHRNTYVNSPVLLGPSHRLHAAPRTYLAGQLIGVEGYLESAMSGLVAAINVAAESTGRPEVIFPADTAIGSLVRYVTTPQRDFAPMNATWGLFPPLEDGIRRDRRERARAHLSRARTSFAAFLLAHPLLDASVRTDTAPVSSRLPVSP